MGESIDKGFEAHAAIDKISFEFDLLGVFGNKVRFSRIIFSDGIVRGGSER